MKKIIIAAVSENNVIGKDGSIPWYSKAELAHFKKMTLNFQIVMRRKTLNSLKNPLPERLNIILSRDHNISEVGENLFFMQSINEVYDFCNRKEFAKLFIIGGEEVFKSMIDQVDELMISRMKLKVIGDTFFPIINPSIWELYERKEYAEFVVEKFQKK